MQPLNFKENEKKMKNEESYLQTLASVKILSSIVKCQIPPKRLRFNIVMF